MPGDNAKPGGRPQNDPDELSRLLELELIQKRAAWQQANARHKTLKSVSIFFLFIVIVGALVGFYLAFSRVNEERGQRPKVAATPAP
jgi:hypothetical protein